MLRRVPAQADARRDALAAALAAVGARIIADVGGRMIVTCPLGAEEAVRAILREHDIVT